jgi:KipI family sensor histidine kinase inhibitor
LPVVRVRRCGSHAALVEVGSTGAALGLHVALRGAPAGPDGLAGLDGLAELVPAARTVLVVRDRPVDPQWLARLAEIARAVTAPGPGGPAPSVRPGALVVPVRYDGPDLDLVARTAGCATDEVIALHSSATYTVAFCGFAPGFGYLTGLPDRLQQPRLARPRPRVAAGSVGVAGEFTGAYPGPGPGGWRLIGHTESVLFDQTRDPPALLAPGSTVRFQPV